MSNRGDTSWAHGSVPLGVEVWVVVQQQALLSCCLRGVATLTLIWRRWLSTIRCILEDILSASRLVEATLCNFWGQTVVLDLSWQKGFPCHLLLHFSRVLMHKRQPHSICEGKPNLSESLQVQAVSLLKVDVDHVGILQALRHRDRSRHKKRSNIAW